MRMNPQEIDRLWSEHHRGTEQNRVMQKQDFAAALQEATAQARAACQGQVPAGWKLAPIEPTDEMADAPSVRVGNSSWDGWQAEASWEECRDIYRAMIAAAPKEPK